MRPLLLGLVAIGTALRLPWLASRPLWLDEALTHHLASAPGPGAVLSRAIAEDLHPPGYALLAHLLLQLGDHDALLRLPALLAGIAAIPAAWAAVRAWTDDRAGLVAAALVATCPPCVAWSREARGYSLALLAVFGLLWAAAEARRGRRLPLVVAALLCLPWHYGAWLVAAAVLTALAVEPSARRAALHAAGALGLGAAPLALLLVPQAAARGDLVHLDRFTGLAALPGLPWFLGWVASGSSGPFALGVGLLLLPLLASRDAARLRVGLAPVGAVLLAALAGLYPLGPVRHDLVLLPGLVLLVAPRLRIGPAVTATVALAAVTLARGPGLPVHDTPALLAELAEREPGPVWIDPMLSWPVIRYGPPEGAVFGRWGERWPGEGWVITTGEEPGEITATGVRAVWVGGADVPRR